MSLQLEMSCTQVQVVGTFLLYPIPCGLRLQTVLTARNRSFASDGDGIVLGPASLTDWSVKLYTSGTDGSFLKQRKRGDKLKAVFTCFYRYEAPPAMFLQNIAGGLLL